jgi:CBS domain-containing protein
LSTNHDEISVRDLMTTGLKTCPVDASLANVATALARGQVHAIFAVDATGRPAGIVSDFDLLAGEWLGADPEDFRTMQRMTAAELMTSPVESVPASATAATAAARMRELHLGRLLVVDDEGSPVGVISVSDLIRPLGEVSGDRRYVKDVMSHAIVTCLQGTSLPSAARAMTERRSRSIVVTDENGQTVGILTGNDLLSLYEPQSRAQTVADLMSVPITCSPDLPLRKAADLMISEEVHRLVVVDARPSHGAPLGIISSSDVVTEMASATSAWQHGPD